MAFSVTYTFANATVADATQVNTNFQDVIDATSDGTQDFNINALTVGGAGIFNGNVTLGNASGDDVTITGSLASNIPIKTNTTYGIGSSTLGLSGIYLGGTSTFTTRLVSSATSSYTITLPVDTGLANQYLVNSGSGTLAWGSALYQIKYLTADISATNTDVSDLKFNNLVVGRVYRITAQWAFNIATSGSRSVDISYLNNSVKVAEWKVVNPSGTDPVFGGTGAVFVAAATTLVCSVTVSSADLLGDGTKAESWAQIEELPTHKVTTAFT